MRPLSLRKKMEEMERERQSGQEANCLGRLGSPVRPQTEPH